MTSLPNRGAAQPSDSPSEGEEAVTALSSSSPSSEQREHSTSKQSKTPSILSGVLTPPFTIFEGHQGSSQTCGAKSPKSSSGSYGWSRILRRIVCSGSMWRFLGCNKVLTSTDVWFLGKCYKEKEESSSNSDSDIGHSAFLQDFSSRIWITYRKGFDAISDSKLTSDVNWGCMVRSSQMLVAQALIFHHLGRSWRKPLEKPYSPEYIGVLHLFGDSEACAFSIHNLLQAGKSYGLAAGSWVGPYAMCRAWQTLVRTNREQASEVANGKENFPMALYVVSGDEDGERGGAPVVCIDVAAKLCHDFNKGQSTWSPILLLVPLVLGLDKINPRYIPLLKETFTFPQSLGILGGKPGTSTYMAGVQDDRALFLDPHEVQLAVNIGPDNLEADTSSYHCSVVRDMALDQIDPSLAIGFYCRDKDDFDDFCSRASDLAEKDNGAPLFTVVQSIQPSRQLCNQDEGLGCSGDGMVNNDDLDGSGETGEEEWQIL